MKRSSILIFYVQCVLVMSKLNFAFSQGCSDAGFCSVGALQTSIQKDATLLNNATLQFVYGAGEQGTIIYNIIPELEFNFLRNYSAQAKIPFVFAHGNLGNNSGIGDLTFSVSRNLLNMEKTKWVITTGIKLPTGTTDAEDANGLSLPMPYQSGLGTTDIILGTSLKINNLKFGAGLQVVLNNQNKNNFTYGNTLLPVNDAYFESKNLDRGNDALLRAEYDVNIKKLLITPGILAIYRLREDKIEDVGGNKFSVGGSDGLTLNLTAAINYSISKKFVASVLFGAPAVVREVRPDGLTRSMVLNLGIQYNFSL